MPVIPANLRPPDYMVCPQPFERVPPKLMPRAGLQCIQAGLVAPERAITILGSRFQARVRGQGPPRQWSLIMKDDIHPKYFENSVVTCGCGNTFTTGSTREKITVEICSACHPFFTGAQKFVDTAGRVEKFQKKFGGKYFQGKDKAKATKA